MKRTQQIVLYTLLILGGTALSAVAQSTSTKDRVDRDVVIFERILEEMFQVELSSENQNQRTPYLYDVSNLRADRNKSVTGSYFEGYGLELNISHTPLSRQIVLAAGQSNVKFTYPVNGDAGQSGVELNTEGVKIRMVEFLKKYAPLFEGLKDDERIVLTYGMPADSRASSTGVFEIFRDLNRQSPAEFPSVAMWVGVNDIKRYKNGRLSASAFEERLQFWDLKKNGEKKHQDQTIFSSILKTSVESADRNYFSGPVRTGFYYIPGLGVQYDLALSMQARVEFDNAIFRSGEDGRVTVNGVLSGTAELLERFAENLKPLEERLDSAAVELDSLIRRGELENRRRLAPADSGRVVIRGFSNHSAVSSDDLQKEIELVVDEVKNVIQNYGPTLSSLVDDEFLSITINWTGRNPNLPSQSRIKITKQDLVRGTSPNVK